MLVQAEAESLLQEWKGLWISKGNQSHNQQE